MLREGIELARASLEASARSSSSKRSGTAKAKGRGRRQSEVEKFLTLDLGEEQRLAVLVDICLEHEEGVSLWLDSTELD